MKKGVKILIAVIAVIVVLGGVFAGLFFGGIIDLMKPTRRTWTKQVQKALNLDGYKLTDYAETLDEYKDMYQKPFKANYTIKADLDISELDEDVQKTINNSTIKVDMAQNRKDKKSYTKFALENSDKKVLDAEVVVDGTKFGVASKDIYDKYLTVSIEDLEEYMKSKDDLDLPSSTTSLTELYNKASELDVYELLYISKDDLKDIQKRYKEVIKKSIDKKCFTKKANVKVDVDGKDVRATGYYLTLSGEDAKKLAEDLLDEIKDDETIANIIKDKYNMIAELADQSKIDTDDAKELLKTYAEQAINALKEIESDKLDEQGVQIAVYSKYNKPVRLEVNLIEDMDKRYDGKTLLSIEYGKKKDIYTLMPDELGLVLTNEYDKKKDDEGSGKLTLTVDGFNGDLATADYEYVNKDNEKKLLFDLHVGKEVLAKYDIDEDINAKIDFSAEGNWKKEPVKMNFSLSGNYGKEKAKISIEGTSEYTDDISIPELNDSNSVAILKLKEDEQAKLLDEILKKASEVLPERLKLIGVEVTPEQIYKTKTVVTPTNPAAITIPEADEFVEGKKTSTNASVGEYTEIIRAGFKDEKFVSIGIKMEFDSEDKANTIYTAYKASGSQVAAGYTVTKEGKGIVLTMDAKTFTTQYNIPEAQCTKELIKSVFEQQGYKVD